MRGVPGSIKSGEPFVGVVAFVNSVNLAVCGRLGLVDSPCGVDLPVEVKDLRCAVSCVCRVLPRRVRADDNESVPGVGSESSP